MLHNRFAVSFAYLRSQYLSCIAGELLPDHRWKKKTWNAQQVGMQPHCISSLCE